MIYLFFIPLIASFVTLFTPLRAKQLKNISFGFSLIPLVLLMLDYGNEPVQLDWIPTLSLDFYLKLDPLAVAFVYLTALIIPISILSMSSKDITSPNAFYALILLTQGLLIGFFTSQNLLLFTLLFEGVLIPIYFIISLWGGVRRQAAAVKFIIYMIAGSTLMIAAVLALYSGSFNFDALIGVAESHPYAGFILAAFLLAFAVKTPLFPFHAWLPDAYTQAPLAGTILLSALLSKAGIFGFLRIGTLFPEFIVSWSPILLSLAIIGVFYGAFAALTQNDFKRLIAYSSFSHVNFILAATFIINSAAHNGAIIQAFNHGITITALFLVAWWLEKRLGETEIGRAEGITKYMPLLSWLTLFFVLSSIALPGTNNFVGELLILIGIFNKFPWAGAILALSVIFSVTYMLRFMQKMFYGEPTPIQKGWIDLRFKEAIVAFPLVVLILWIGIYPATLLTKIAPQTQALEKAQ